MTEIPVDVMRDIRRKHRDLKAQAQREQEDANAIMERAKEKYRLALELESMADAWKKMFPDTTDDS